jgi:hypothetical protein
MPPQNSSALIFSDTMSFHLGVTFACVLMLRVLEWYSATLGQLSSPKLGTRAEFQ